MAYRIRGLNQSCTYWGNPASDGYGWYTFDDPVLIDCRWEEKQVLFRTPNGEEKLSSAIVYIGQDVDLGGYVALGDYTDSIYSNPKDVSSSRKIENCGEVPNLRGTTSLVKIFGGGS